MPSSDPLLLEVCGYENLEAALYYIYDHMNDPPGEEEEEEWLINLQNRLIWGYEVGENEDHDTVVLEAIQFTMRDYNLSPAMLTGEVKRILDDLTLA